MIMKKFFFPLVFIYMLILVPAAYAADALVTGTVNLRGGPGVKYAKRGVIHPGTRLNISRCQGNWCKIYSRRGTGWVSSRYLAFNRQVVAPRYYRTHPVVVMSVTIGSRPRPYYRSYHYRGHRYRTHYHRRHHGTIRHHRYYHNRFNR